MLIRKNTKAFKTVKEIINSCKDKPNRKDLIRLYITKAGHTIADRISVEALQGDADLFYAINYDAVWNNLSSADRQLHQSDSVPGIYFFQTNANKQWDETPFEFGDGVLKEFSTLPELPAVRKKERVANYVFPPAISEPGPTGKKSPKAKVIPPPAAARKQQQPTYGLKHTFEFTGLADVVFEDGKVTKKAVLDYYNKISGRMLPHLKDRPLSVHPFGADADCETLEQLLEITGVPDWFKSDPRSGALLCNDHEHLLWYAEMGCIEFRVAHSKIKSIDTPDYSVVCLTAADADSEDLAQAASKAREILTGLKLPLFVKTDGRSALHIYLPLEPNSTFAASRKFAEYLCNLVKVKDPLHMGVANPEPDLTKKISASPAGNEPGKFLLAPYSLVAGKSPIVAAPVSWDEIEQDFNLSELTAQKILTQNKDPFAPLFKKKFDVKPVLKRLEENYSFLFDI